MRFSALWRNLVHRDRVERDLDDEVRATLDLLIEEKTRAGMPEKDARRAAALELGGVESVKAQVRDAKAGALLDDLHQDLTQAARRLRRSPRFSLVVLSTLAMAIGAAVTVFSVIDAWLLRPLNFPHAEQLVIAFAAAPERPAEPAVWLPYRAYLAWKDRARSFSSISAAFFRGVTVTTTTDARSAVGLRVTPEFFDTFGVQPSLGRTLSAADATGPAVVVLSHGFWQEQFSGSRAVLGTPVTLSDVSYDVVGVMPRDFDVRMLDRPDGAAFWTPIRADESGYGPDGVGPVAIIGRLRNDVTMADALTEVAAITQESESRYSLNFNQFVVNLSSLQVDNTRTVRLTLLTVSASVVGLLLIAALNVGTLLLGRGLERLRETAVRAALGSSRARLFRQFLTESLLIAVLGGGAGLGLAAAAIPLLLAWNPLETLPANAVRLDVRALAAAGGAMFVTTIVCGLVPALRMSAASPADVLRAGAVVAPTVRVQTVMLAGQIAGSLVLLIAAILLARTVGQLRTEPLGFDATNLAVASIVLPRMPFDAGDTRVAYYDQLADRVRAMPGVRAVAASTALPLTGGAIVTVHTSAEDSVEAPRISAEDVTTAFFDTLGIPLVAGRTFDARDGAEAPLVTMLNARAAEELFGRPGDAIGRRVRVDREPWREVIGVVGNVRRAFFNTLEWRTDSTVYRPAAQAFTAANSPAAASFSLFLHVRSDQPLNAADLRAATSAAGPRAAMTELRHVSDMVDAATRQPAVRRTLLLGLTVGSLVLVAMGIYGHASQIVTQRLRDVAIRLAIGADRSRIILVLTRQTLVMAFAGLGVGILAMFPLGSLLESLLYGVPARDAASFSAAALLLLLVVTVTALVPALRVARTDPMKVLRAE